MRGFKRIFHALWSSSRRVVYGGGSPQIERAESRSNGQTRTGTTAGSIRQGGETSSDDEGVWSRSRGTRLTAIELCLDGSAFTATALQTPMRMSARRASDHLKILCQIGVFQQRIGYDKRETEYFIRPGFVRRAENGTAIFDFGSGQLHFPRVRLPE